MIEREWVEAATPQTMLGWLKRRPANDRRLRLFACACCRRIWDLLPDERFQRGVQVAEWFAERAVDPGVLATVEAELEKERFGCYTIDCWDEPYLNAASHAALAVCLACSRGPLCARVVGRVAAECSDAFASVAARHTWHEGRFTGDGDYYAARETEEAAQAGILRDLIGNPFRVPLPTSPATLAWGGGLLKVMASSICEENRFDRLPILGDALDDAGCTDTDLLSHLRGPGPHVRGCWAIDLLLGKE